MIDVTAGERDFASVGVHISGAECEEDVSRQGAIQWVDNVHKGDEHCCWRLVSIEPSEAGAGSCQARGALAGGQSEQFELLLSEHPPLFHSRQGQICSVWSDSE